MTMNFADVEPLGTLEFSCDAGALSAALKRAAVVSPESRTRDRAPHLIVTPEDQTLSIWSHDQVRYVRVSVPVIGLCGPRRTFAYPVQYLPGVRFADGPMRWWVRFAAEGTFLGYRLADGTTVEHSTQDARSDLHLRRDAAAARSHGSVPAPVLLAAVMMARSVLPARDDAYTDQRHRMLTLQPAVEDEPGYVFGSDGIREVLVQSSVLRPSSPILIKDTHVPFLLKFLAGLLGTVEVRETAHHILIQSDGALLGIGRTTHTPARPRRELADQDHAIVRTSRKELIRVLAHIRSEMAIGYMRLRFELDLNTGALTLSAKWPGGAFASPPLSVEVRLARRPLLKTSLHLDHFLDAVESGVSNDVELRLFVPKPDEPELVLGRIAEEIAVDANGLQFDPAGTIPKHRLDPVERIRVVRHLPCMRPL